MRRDHGKNRFLFHGTRYPAAILASDSLRCPIVGQDRHVSLTRNWDVAVYFAELTRDDDEGEGCIFIFDRSTLKGGLAPVALVSEEWEGDDEHEEAVETDIAPLSAHLVATVPVR